VLGHILFLRLVCFVSSNFPGSPAAAENVYLPSLTVRVLRCPSKFVVFSLRSFGIVSPCCAGRCTFSEVFKCTPLRTLLPCVADRAFSPQSVDREAEPTPFFPLAAAFTFARVPVLFLRRPDQAKWCIPLFVWMWNLLRCFFLPTDTPFLPFVQLVPSSFTPAGSP